MGDNRAKDALCHWRHLTVIATHSNINGTPVAAEDVSQEVRDTLQAGCCRWAARAIEYSQGMLWLQNDILFFPNEWTWGHPYTTFEPSGYVTGIEDVYAGCATVGVRVACYDSFSFLIPSITSHNVASGLSFAEGPPGANYLNWIVYDHVNWNTEEFVEFIADVQTHEFAHSLSLYFGDYGHHLLMAWPDGPQLYEHLDGTPLNNDSTVPSHDDFAFCLYHGDLRQKSDHLACGVDAAKWALGPPRKNWPH